MLKRLLKLAVSIILVIVILKIVGIDRLADNLIAVNGLSVFLALCLSPFVVILGTEKWRKIIRHEAKISFIDALISFLGGMSLGLITPARIGELGRIAFIVNGRKAVLAGIALFDRVIDLEVTLAIGLIGAHVLLGYSGLLLVIVSVLVGGTILFVPQKYFILCNKIIRRLPYQHKIEAVMAGVKAIPDNTLLACLFLRVVVSLIDLFQFYILLNAFASVSIIPVFVVYPVIIIINILPVTFMGIGMREGVAMLTLSKFGVPPEASVSASFLLFSINTLMPGIVGTLLISRMKLVTKM